MSNLRRIFLNKEEKTKENSLVYAGSYLSTLLSCFLFFFLSFFIFYFFQLQYERFKNFATEEFVLQNGGILCPGEGCGNGLMLEDATRRIICYRSRGGCGVSPYTVLLSKVEAVLLLKSLLNILIYRGFLKKR